MSKEDYRKAKEVRRLEKEQKQTQHFCLLLNRCQIKRPCWDDEDQNLGKLSVKEKAKLGDTLWLTDLSNKDLQDLDMPDWLIEEAKYWREDTLASSYVVVTVPWALRRLAWMEPNRPACTAQVKELLDALMRREWRAEITRLGFNGITGELITGRHTLLGAVEYRFPIIASVSVTHNPVIYRRVEGNRIRGQTLPQLCIRNKRGTLLEKYSDEDIDLITRIGRAIHYWSDRSHLTPNLKGPEGFIAFLELFEEGIAAVMNRIVHNPDNRTNWVKSGEMNARTLAAFVSMYSVMPRTDWECAADVWRGAEKDCTARYQPVADLRTITHLMAGITRNAYHECYLYVIGLVALKLVMDDRFNGMLGLEPKDLNAVWTVDCEFCSRQPTVAILKDGIPQAKAVRLPAKDWKLKNDKLLIEEEKKQLLYWHTLIFPDRKLGTNWHVSSAKV